jgi:branched-subunit amino acid aminotransferase/4-amino-4-deoxychorismate lyase
MKPRPSRPDDQAGQTTDVPRIGYHNGEWIEADRIAVPVGDAAVTHAATAVERLRCYGGRFFQLARHLERWERTTAALSLQGLPSRDRLTPLLHELVRRNEDWIADHPEFGVVLVGSPGSSGLPTLIADLYAIDSEAMSKRIAAGMPLVVTGIQQPPEASWPRNVKVRCRLHYYLADLQARRVDPAAVGVLIDADGSLTETSIANLLIVQDGRVISPAADQILTGVSLQVVRELAAEAGIDWQQRRIWPADLSAAEEVLLTGTSCGLWFAASIDGSPRQPGPVYRELRRRFDERVGIG